MRILTIPNWSFGRDASLLDKFEEALALAGVTVHYAASDADHNRTVTAFSGELAQVETGLMALCELAFQFIDMRTHRGVHPRLGALDVCPFVPLEIGGAALREALALAERVSSRIAGAYDLPVFLYEKSERGRHEADLPALRRGGFEGLFTRELRPDFGPAHPHPKLGATVLGVRDFLIALNVDLNTEILDVAQDIAREIREYRADGDPRFLGVRALGIALESRHLTQVSMNLTLPDSTPIDPIIDWIETRAAEEGILVASTELIGVIRDRDLINATELHVDPRQVVKVPPLPHQEGRGKP
jgi:glutamate formiminotransferase